MSKYISLKIETAYVIKGRGLILIPTLYLPKVSGFKPFTGNVEVLLPDGKKKEYTAQFLLTHYNLDNGIGQWKIEILLPNIIKNELPDGSEINVADDISNRLQAGNQKK